MTKELIIRPEKYRMDKMGIRAFVAVELPQFVTGELKKIQEELRKDARRESGWVRAENIHLTLKFMDEVKAEDIDKIARELMDAGRDITPFTLFLGEITIKNGRLLWVEVDDHEMLAALKNNIDDALSRLGFEREVRPFKAHLTLCRIKNEAHHIRLKRRLGAVGRIQGAVKFEVTGFVFMRSELTPSGAEYSVIRHIPLRTPS
ncbi:MAG: RNA 2',3'-cyclic phosphodiesterase [Deltaproteobacteria bacterium]|nr:RNA 2',3'-cyclic phosphodiesterase [Deltaproteobacteria bacterium]